MISPTSAMPVAGVESMVPRVLVESQVSRSGDTVEVLRPRRARDPIYRHLIARFGRRKSRYERFPLDARGSRIWCLIDNRRTVGELIGEYRLYYPDDHRQLEGRVLRYLQTLADHGFIEIVTG